MKRNFSKAEIYFDELMRSFQKEELLKLSSFEKKDPKEEISIILKLLRIYIKRINPEERASLAIPFKESEIKEWEKDHSKIPKELLERLPEIYNMIKKNVLEHSPSSKSLEDQIEEERKNTRLKRINVNEKWRPI